VDPLIVYPPDGRHVFKDTIYPWRACGRVITSAGQGAGALVGPRLLLTASHVLAWTASDAGTLLLQPDYYNGDVCPSLWAEGTYTWRRDYVVCVLRDRLDDQLSRLGTATDDGSWNGGSY
jgi:hypothetical protein